GGFHLLDLISRTGCVDQKLAFGLPSVTILEDESFLIPVVGHLMYGSVNFEFSFFKKVPQSISVEQRHPVPRYRPVGPQPLLESLLLRDGKPFPNLGRLIT